MLHVSDYVHGLDQRKKNFGMMEDFVHCMARNGVDVCGQVGSNWVHASGLGVEGIRQHCSDLSDKYETRFQMAGYADGIDTLDTMTLSRGVLDMSMVSPVTHDLMTVSGEMFASETVMAELSKAVQLIMWFPQGPSHFAVRANSRIATLDDIAGATIYLGPHTQSAAYYDAQSWIAATTGLIAEQDYVSIAGTWAAGAEAFLSGDLDVFISACFDPCPRLETLAGLVGIRMIAPSDLNNEEVNRFFSGWSTQGKHPVHLARR